MGDELGLRLQVLERAVHGEGIVAEIVVAEEVVPAERIRLHVEQGAFPKADEGAVAVAAEIFRPADATPFQHEFPNVHMAVGAARVAGLEADPDVILCPPAPHRAKGIEAADDIEEFLRRGCRGEVCDGLLPRSCAPDQHQRVVAGIGAVYEIRGGSPAVQHEFLRIQQRRVAGLLVEPENAVLRQIVAGTVVAERERLLRIGQELGEIFPRLHKAGNALQRGNAFGAEVHLHRVQIHHVERGTVSPVADSL